MPQFLDDWLTPRLDPNSAWPGRVPGAQTVRSKAIMRSMFRRSVEHERSRAESNNERVRTAFRAYPITLLGLVVADVYLSQEFSALERHLITTLPERGLFPDVQDRIRDYFRRARRGVGAGSLSLGPFVRPEHRPGWPGVGRYEGLPESVDFAEFYLSQPCTGVVILAAVAEATDQIKSAPARIVERTDQPRVRRKKHSIEHDMVEALKAEALAAEVRRLVTIDVFPADCGLLRSRRYPTASTALYRLPTAPDPEDRNWIELADVLNVDPFDALTDGRSLLLSGVAGKRLSREGGRSWIFLDDLWADWEAQGYPDQQGAMVQSVQDLIMEFGWAWVALSAGVAELAVLADEKRALLENKMEHHGPLHGQGDLEDQLMGLETLQYQLAKVKLATSDIDDEVWGFRDLADLAPWPAVRADKTGWTFAQVVRETIKAQLEYAHDNNDISRRLADRLLQLRIQISMRTWTIVAVLVNIVVLAVAVIAINGHAGSR